MAKPQACVITSNRRLQRHVTRALGSADWVVHSASFDRGLLGGALEQAGELFIIDGDFDLDEVRWVLGHIGQHHPKAQMLVLSHESGDGIVLDLFATTSLSNFVGRHGEAESSQDMIDEDELIVTCNKLVHEDIFGLDKYMSTWGMRLHQRRIQSTDEKIEAIGELEAFLVKLDCYRGILPAIALVGEELIMNALFNAPRDDSGGPKYAGLDRRKPLRVEDHEAVDFVYACDGCYVGLAVRDRFGALQRDQAVKNIERCYRRAQGDVDETGVEAGLGLYMVFNSITQLVLNLGSGNATEVIAMFYVRSGARAFKASGRSFNLFSR